MKINNHLTEKQLLSYADGSLNKQDSQIVGSHLLSCVDCREALPVPTAQRFFELFTEDFNERKEENVKQKDKESFSLLPVFSYLSSFIGQPQTLILGSTGLVLILSFTFLIWFNSKSMNQEIEEVAIAFEIKKEGKENFNINKDKERKVQSNQKDLTNKNKDFPLKDNEKLNTIISGKNQVIKEKPIYSTKFKNKNDTKKLKKKTKKISTTRGRGSDCKDEKVINVTFEPKEKAFVFKWKKVPNAKKYSLYISDNDEILIDEFETKSATSYILRKSLDKTKIYNWKLLVELKNGKTIVGKSQKFTLGKRHKSKEKTDANVRSLTRCSANN